MAVRYCGGVTLRIVIQDAGGFITPASYTARLSVAGVHLSTVSGIQNPACYRGRIDAPECFDGIAQAALSFAVNGCSDAADKARQNLSAEDFDNWRDYAIGDIEGNEEWTDSGRVIRRGKPWTGRIGEGQ